MRGIQLFAILCNLDVQSQCLKVLQIIEDVERICGLGETHDFEHVIVDGKIIDSVSAVSLHANRLQKMSNLPTARHRIRRRTRFLAFH